MALKCRCICGCKLLVSSDSAGKRIKCPKCERKLRVPVDVVEKRRAQLESRQAGPRKTTPRSKIEQPLSSLVDLPEPEPPPIQLVDLSEPTTALTQPNEPATPPATRSGSPTEKAEIGKPPPLPNRSKDRAVTRHEPVGHEEPTEPANDEAAQSPLPAGISPAPPSDPTAVDDVGEVPLLETDDVALPVRGYQADRDRVATVRWLAAAILLTGLVGMVPAIIDVVEHSLSETSEGLSRWACGLFLVGLLQCAYAVYLVQLPDWSSVWVVTCFTLVIAASYAAMFGLTLLSSERGDFVQVLDLADRLRGGKATAWCLIMLSLTSLTSYFSGRVGARWRSAFVA